MKTLLIVIGTLNAGGAEKSLVSLLNTLPIDKYKIDLMLLTKEGVFLPLVPKNVNIITPPNSLKTLNVPLKRYAYYLRNPFYFVKKLLTLYRTRQKGSLNINQFIWQEWCNKIPCYTEKYDVAISYIEGITNYYVIDKISAKKKIIWIHNEYGHLNYNKDFDTRYFQKADAIITISKLCRDSLVENFPMLQERIFVLENITNPLIIKNMSLENIDDPIFNEAKGVKLLSVGRLTPQKNYELAIRTAVMLKENGLVFSWFILGDGVLRSNLEKLIRTNRLEGAVFLLGVKSNPYYYMRHSDIIVQTSLFEGKSIAIDEAKILNKPIVSTNYNTVHDLISNGVNGIITEMNAQSLSSAILKLVADENMRKKISDNLKLEDIDNTAFVYEYIKLIDQ